MQPFTFDQAIVAGLLFLLGLLIGMFLFAGSKWKRRYKAEHERVRELEQEVQHLGRENREFQTLRERAERHPASGPLAPDTRHSIPTAPAAQPRPGQVGPGEIGHDWKPYSDRDGDGVPNAVDRRP